MNKCYFCLFNRQNRSTCSPDLISITMLDFFLKKNIVSIDTTDVAVDADI